MTSEDIQQITRLLLEKLHISPNTRLNLKPVFLEEKKDTHTMILDAQYALDFLVEHQSTFSYDEVHHAVQTFYGHKNMCDVRTINAPSDISASDIQAFVETLTYPTNVFHINPEPTLGGLFKEPFYLLLSDTPKIQLRENAYLAFSQIDTPFYHISQPYLMALYTLLILHPDSLDILNDPEEPIENLALTYFLNPDPLKTIEAFITQRNYNLFKEAVSAFKQTYEALIHYTNPNWKPPQRAPKTSSGTVWRDKAYIPKAHLDKMENNGFLTRGFCHVEIDESFPLKSFDQLEKEFTDVLYPLLPPLKRPLTLRFRKLGRHRATGLYNNQEATIALDPRKTTPFIHEYAHALDYSVHPQHSKRDDFQPFVDFYRKEIPSALPTYYRDPGEIFARAFEFYIATKTKHVKTNLHTSYDDLSGELPFHPFFRHDILSDMLTKYFDKLVVDLQRKEELTNG